MKKLILLFTITFCLNVAFAQQTVDSCHIALVKYQQRSTGVQPLPLLAPNFMGYEFGFNSYNIVLEAGMHYDSIGNGKISDICFYVSDYAGYKIKIAGAADDIFGKVYLAGPDSMPVGEAIAEGQITSNDFVPAGGAIWSQITFLPLNCPVSVNSSYFLSISNPWWDWVLGSNPDPDTFGIIGNKPNQPGQNDGDGLGEHRARFLGFDTVISDFAWMRCEGIFGVDFNCDALIMPVYESCVPTSTADFSVPSSTLCPGQCFDSITDLSTNAVSWDWTFDVPPYGSFLQNPKNICFNTAGSFVITLNITDASSNCYSISKIITVTNTSMTPNFISSDDTLCKNQCIDFSDNSIGNPNSWEWTFNGASTPTSTNQNPVNICYPDTGTFDVTLKIINSNCMDTVALTKTIVVKDCGVGIPNKKSNGVELKWVYPNPANDRAIICYGLKNTSSVKITVFNTLSGIVFDSGKKVESTGEHKKVVDVSKLPSGKYYYRIQTNETQMMGSFVITR